jgi:acyl carrier protein
MTGVAQLTRKLLAEFIGDHELEMNHTFFENGGTSIDAVGFILKLEKLTGISLAPETILGLALKDLIARCEAQATLA